MFSLVLFTGRNPKTSAVISSARVRLIEHGPKASIKWYNGKSYVGNVLRTGDDEKALRKLTVLTSGKIENEKIPQSGSEEISHQFLHPAPSESSPSTASSAPTEGSSSPPATSTDEDSLSEQSSTHNVSTTIEEQVPTSSSPDDSLKPSAATTNENMLPPSSTTVDNNSPPDDASTSHGELVPFSSPSSNNNVSTENVATTTEEHAPSSSTPNDEESQPRKTTPTIEETVPASTMPNDVDSRTVPVVIREERREQQSTKGINISISIIVPNIDKDARTGITAQREDVPSHIEAHAVPSNIQPSASSANTMEAGPELATMIELAAGSGVMIKAFRLNRILKDHGSEPCKLVRQLLNEIVGIGRLKKMRSKGRGGWERIPQDVLDAIEEFVATHTNDALTHKKYSAIIVKYLNYLHNQ